MIRLYSGLLFDPLNPDPNIIEVHSLGHSLSLLTRYGGHCSVLYSIAQHVVLAAELVEKYYPKDDEGLETLHHDDPEGLGIVDMPRPVKHADGMFFYRQTEAGLQNAVNIAFNLKDKFKWVKWADDQMLVNEMKVIAPHSYPFYSKKLRDQGIEEIDLKIKPWSSDLAEYRYIELHKKLVEKRARLNRKKK